ncbi:MAG: hypothetical protein WCG78_03120 [Candidatus Omnitrophota bacterium]
MDIFYRNDRGVRKREVAFVLLVAALFIVVMRDLLIFGRLIFTHDTIAYFGLMHYFYNSLMSGVFPYWDIYNYCGQPFYYNLGIARVFEVPTLVLAGVARCGDWSLLSLYHWDYCLKILLYVSGVYMALRQLSTFTLSVWVGFFAFVFSSFTLASLRQPGLITTFAWTPWAVWFLLRLRREFSLFNMVGFSLFTGLLATSYQVGYSFTFLQLLSISIAVSDRAWIAGICRDPRKLMLLGVGAVIVLALSLQLVAVFIEKERSTPVMRQGEDSRQEQPYDTSVGGSPAAPGDTLGLFFLPLAMKAAGGWPVTFSEASLYIGILPLLFALCGIFFSRHRYRLHFLFMLAALIFLSLNGRQLFGPFAVIIFPFLKYTRNMEIFQPFILFTLVYFTAQGVDLALGWCERQAGGGGADAG